MSRSPDRLYELLPVVHRMRDAEIGEPLRALLRVVNEQVDTVEDDIAALYENWFIETCEEWVVPYIGDLIGYLPVHEAGDPSDVASAERRLRNKFLIPRQEVANTLGYRRRKGTLALLDALAEAVTGWPSVALEFYRRLGWTQHVNHLRLHRAHTVDLRDGGALDLIGSAFDHLARSVDVRRIVSHRQLGRYNIPSVGVFVWRLKSYSITHAPAYCLESEGPQCFTFSILGNDAPLFVKPEPDASPRITEELNVPVPIRRRALEQHGPGQPAPAHASGRYYGLDQNGVPKSIAIYAPDWPKKDAAQPIPCEIVVPADLTNWQYRAKRNPAEVALDPVLGRIVFPIGLLPKRGVSVSYRYGFSADMGGGEYRRTVLQPAAYTLYSVGQGDDKKLRSIDAALEAWRKQQDAVPPMPADGASQEEKDAWEKDWREPYEELRAAVIEIEDSGVYSEQLTIVLKKGESLQICAKIGRVR